MLTRTGYGFVAEKEDSFIAESLYDGHRVIVYKDRMRKPRRNSPSELLKAGVLLDSWQAGISMTCIYCGQTWYPRLGRGGHFNRGEWKCLHGCNSDL